MWTAAGVLMVAVDVRTERLDLLPDPVGWSFVALGAWRLSVGRAASVALLAAVLSISAVHLPYEFVPVDPITGEEMPRDLGSGEETSTFRDSGLPEHLRFLDVTGWRLAATTGAMVAGGVALWLLLTDLEQRSAGAGRQQVGKAFLALRWLMAIGWLAPYLAVVATAVATDSGRFDAVWNGGLEPVGLVGVLILAVLALVLGKEANRAWATPPGVIQPSRWGEGWAEGPGRGGTGDGDARGRWRRGRRRT